MTPLPWDSEFFGMRVARVDAPDLTLEALAPILGGLGSEGVRLVYWPSSAEQDRDTIQKLGGVLVDTKTTFLTDLRGLRAGEVRSRGAEPLSPRETSAELAELAIQAGEFSRFARDPRIPRTKFEALYRRWIEGAVAGELARDVLVIKEGDRVAGLVTVGERNGRGEIGLLAVSPAFRGKGVGRRLVESARSWSVREGHSSAQVVTQAENAPACGLYASCGYLVERVDYFHHFWL